MRAVRLHHASLLDRSVQALFGSVGNRFGPSSISCRSGPTPSQKMSVLRIGPDRTETEPRLSIPDHSWKKVEKGIERYMLTNEKDIIVKLAGVYAKTGESDSNSSD